MPTTRILLLVPPAGPAARIIQELCALPAPSGPPGLPAETAFSDLTAAQSDLLWETLSREGIPHVAITEARFDPSMCMPQPAVVRVDCPGLLSDGTHHRLPLGFPAPGFDVATLTAAGLSEADALAALDCLSERMVALAA